MLLHKRRASLISPNTVLVVSVVGRAEASLASACSAASGFGINAIMVAAMRNVTASIRIVPEIPTKAMRAPAIDKPINSALRLTEVEKELPASSLSLGSNRGRWKSRRVWRSIPGLNLET